MPIDPAKNPLKVAVENLNTGSRSTAHAQPDITQFATHDSSVANEGTMQFRSAQPTTPTSPPHFPETAAPRLKTGRFGFLKRHQKLLASFLVVLLLIVGTMVAVGLYTLTVVTTLQAQAQEAATISRGALDQFKAQNLPGSEAEFKKLQEKVGQIKATYAKLSFYRYVPLASAYYQDGEHGLVAAEAGINAGLRAIAAVAPYADVLGFTGEGTFEGGTAENRVKLILETLEKITPELDAMAADLETAKNELNQIDEKRYPEQVKGIAVRQKIAESKDLLANASTILADYRPILEQLPSIAGADGERRKYLVLFQNDNELRATGGFLTAYSVIFIENGVVTPEKSDDIYELDKKFTKKIAIPESLGRYLTTERYFNLRDMNISPDFKQSMDLFFENYSQLRGEPGDIDGIIAVDTHVLNDLVRIVGPIEVAGYGTFTAENDPKCDCPQIIYALSEIITRPTPYIRQDRKGILAPLMQAILQRIYQSPKTFMADLFQVGLDNLEGRHVQMYFFDEKNQAAAEAINAAGRLNNEEGAQDFLAIVDSNLGGAKSNLFVKHDVKQVVSAPENGVITKTVEITYKNPRRADNCNLEAGLLCLNSTLRDWNRIYLPPGAELIESQGYNEEAKVYEENGFKVIDGFFILEPLGQAKIRLTYTVPYTDDVYRVKLWKQGGTDPVVNFMDVNGGEEEIVQEGDMVYKAEF